MQSKTMHEPFVRVVKRGEMPMKKKVFVRLAAVALALVADALFIFFVTGLNPIDVYKAMIQGTFSTSMRFSWAMRDLASLLLIGIALFNFSAELLSAALLALLWLGGERGMLRDKLSREPLSQASLGVTVLTLVVLQLVACALILLWQPLLRSMNIPFDDTQEVVTQLQNGGIGLRIFLFLVVTTIVPLAEELFFRRVLFGLLLPHLGGMGGAVAVALLFGAAHGFLAGFPALFWMGLCFQWIYWRTGNFCYPVILHSMVNLWGCLLAFLSL